MSEMQNSKPGWKALALALSFSLSGAGAFAAAVSAGSLGPASTQVFGPASGGTTTLVDLVRPVIGNGVLTSATLIWAGGPCEAGFRLKFFRPEPGAWSTWASAVRST